MKFCQSYLQFNPDVRFFQNLCFAEPHADSSGIPADQKEKAPLVKEAADRGSTLVCHSLPITQGTAAAEPAQTHGRTWDVSAARLSADNRLSVADRAHSPHPFLPGHGLFRFIGIRYHYTRFR